MTCFFQPENCILVSARSKDLKICDFGLTVRADPHSTVKTVFTSPEYIAPEVVNFDKISFATDMWNVGVTAYVL